MKWLNLNKERDLSEEENHFCGYRVINWHKFFKCLAQNEDTAEYTKLSLGYSLHEFDQDFGYGLSFTSPYFLSDRVAIRFSVSRAFLEGIPEGKTAYEWMPYTV
ncbi:MAG: hypothetical protein GX493_10950 [Firmicutes bacterium]|nr:hypothetical protein [Bacillota bacterium]